VRWPDMPAPCVDVERARRVLQVQVRLWGGGGGSGERWCLHACHVNVTRVKVTL
jgi:hypothetical protein